MILYGFQSCTTCILPWITCTCTRSIVLFNFVMSNRMLCWLVRCGGLVLTIEFVFVLVCDLFAVLFYVLRGVPNVCTIKAVSFFNNINLAGTQKQNQTNHGNFLLGC